MQELTADFFCRNTVAIAQELLGKVMYVNGLLVRIVETEAYGQDPASHAFTKTKRSALMYDTFGHVYVYLIYGMYYCVNITTEPIGEPGAVLIRAVEPMSGIKEMIKARGTDKLINLCSGPGKLCEALGITTDFNGLKLGKEIKIFNDNYIISNQKIGRSSRIGIKDALNLKWRFFIKGNEFVSKK